jgi:hypothetical protein
MKKPETIQDIIRKHNRARLKEAEELLMVDMKLYEEREYTQETVRVALNEQFPMRKNLQDW